MWTPRIVALILVNHGFYKSFTVLFQHTKAWLGLLKHEYFTDMFFGLCGDVSSFSLGSGMGSLQLDHFRLCLEVLHMPYHVWSSMSIVTSSDLRRYHVYGVSYLDYESELYFHLLERSS